MKELIKSLFALAGALIVSIFLIPCGLLYTIFYGWVFSKRAKKGNRFLYLVKFFLRIVDGILAAFGHLIYALAYCLDLIWNMLGEMLEDGITTKENTEFTNKNVSVSAAIGKLEIDGDLNKRGRWLSKVLNIAFGQKSHARGAWEYLQTKLRLEKELFNQQ